MFCFCSALFCFFLCGRKEVLSFLSSIQIKPLVIPTHLLPQTDITLYPITAYMSHYSGLS